MTITKRGKRLKVIGILILVALLVWLIFEIDTHLYWDGFRYRWGARLGL